MTCSLAYQTVQVLHSIKYADDTKIWREIKCFYDHFVLQNDIEKLLRWSLENKMKFHPSKCKALTVTLQRNVLDNLPFNHYHYMLGVMLSC